MVAVDFIRFLAMLVIAGALLRFLQGRLAGTQVGTALAYIY